MSNCLAIASIQKVFPVPGGPESRRLLLVYRSINERSKANEVKTVGADWEGEFGGFAKEKASVPFDLLGETAGKGGEGAVGGVEREEIGPGTMRKGIELRVGRDGGVKRGRAEIKCGGGVAVANVCDDKIENFVFQVATA